MKLDSSLNCSYSVVVVVDDDDVDDDDDDDEDDVHEGEECHHSTVLDNTGQRKNSPRSWSTDRS